MRIITIGVSSILSSLPFIISGVPPGRRGKNVKALKGHSRRGAKWMMMLLLPMVAAVFILTGSDHRIILHVIKKTRKLFPTAAAGGGGGGGDESTSSHCCCYHGWLFRIDGVALGLDTKKCGGVRGCSYGYNSTFPQQQQEEEESRNLTLPVALLHL